MKRNFRPLAAVPALLLLFAALSGCRVKYVADYDAKMREEIIQVARKADLFWADILDADDREYNKFKKRHNEIETDIRWLWLRNQIRPDNEETAKQAKKILYLWTEDKKLHKKNNGFSTFEARRRGKQYLRAFTAMLKGEEAKRMKQKAE